MRGGGWAWSSRGRGWPGAQPSASASGGRGAWQRLRRPTARARIALAFGAAFALLGGLLLGAVYVLSWLGTRAGTSRLVNEAAGAAAQPVSAGGAAGIGTAPGTVPYPVGPGQATITESATGQRLRDLGDSVGRAASRQQLEWSLLALLITVVLAVAVGWWTAGRALRPVHKMTATARRISANNLHERIALAGPRDELGELADTFDELLTRLDAAFDSQRRFVSHASHELRTPLAVQRAAIQIGLENPDAQSLPQVRNQLLAANRRSEQLIEGLLSLARSDLGPERLDPVDWAAVVGEQLAECAREARLMGITIQHRVSRVSVLGDAVLLGQLVGNLLRNAIRHNHTDGRVDVNLGPAGLVVRNTGPLLEPAVVPELFEPFRRIPRPRRGLPGRPLTPRPRDPEPEGIGLGLSVVRSITTAHGGTVTAHANPDGGLTIEVALPEAAAQGR